MKKPHKHKKKRHRRPRWARHLYTDVMKDMERMRMAYLKEERKSLIEKMHVLNAENARLNNTYQQILSDEMYSYVIIVITGMICIACINNHISAPYTYLVASVIYTAVAVMLSHRYIIRKSKEISIAYKRYKLHIEELNLYKSFYG